MSLRTLLSSFQRGPAKRLGNRADIRQPGVLEINGRVLTGVIENVGLKGAFFTTKRVLPAHGIPGTLFRQGGERGIDVHVVWRREGKTPGVGLRFAA